MFQTEFCGSDHKFVISWDPDASPQSFIRGKNDGDGNLFSKLNELYLNISKFTTEFVDCVKRVNNVTDVGQLSEVNPNVSFKIENLKNSEPFPDEVHLLKKEIEKLKYQKEQIENDYKNCMLRHEEEISKLREEEQMKLRKLENQYELDMSDLRVYFENSFADSLKQLHEVNCNQYARNKTSDANLGNDAENENYQILDFQCYNPDFNLQSTRDSTGKLEISDESKIKIKENINKVLQNLIKAYNSQIIKFRKDCEERRNDEIKEHKLSLKVKYSSIIDGLQSKINQLVYEKSLEDKVKEVHRILKEESLAELNVMHNEVDNAFLQKVENDKHILEQKLKSKFHDEVCELINEWKNKSEELLSDVIVDSAVKSVTHEVTCKSSCHSTRTIEETETRLEKMEEEYGKKLNLVKTEYENRIRMMVMNFDQDIEKLNVEKEALVSQIKSLEVTNDHFRAEIENVKADFVERLKLFQSIQDRSIDMEKMEIELNNLRAIHESEVTKLRDENSMLQKRINMLELDRENDQQKRSKIMSHLLHEIEDLIVKEENGDCITWPSDLAALEQLFSRKLHSGKTSSPTNLTEYEKSSMNIHDFDSKLNVEEILKERDALRKVNIALHGVVNVYTKYLTNCEEELNNTLIGELVKLDRIKKPFNNSFDEESLSDVGDINLEDGVKKVHFAPDISELLTSLRGDLNLDATTNCNVSVIESELNACLERLKNEAAAVLSLTSGKKFDADANTNELRSTEEVAAQTELNKDQLKANEEKIRQLEKGLSEAEIEIVNLTTEVARLTEKINSLESIEGYGEVFNAPFSSGRFQNSAVSEDVANYGIMHVSDDYCPKCDKIIEEARKEIEDRQLQFQAADNKLRSLEQFLERQTTEREHERSDFDLRIEQLQEQLKEQERDYMSKYEADVNHLHQQIKKLTSDLEQSLSVRENLETKLKSSHAKIIKLKEYSDDLENKVEQKSELTRRLEAKLREKEELFLQYQKECQTLIQQLECMPEGNMKELEELNEQHIITSAMIDQVKNEIFEVEKLVISRTRELESKYLPVLSNSIISSPSEDVSVCDRIAERVKVTSPNGSDPSSPIHIPINQLSCLHDKIKRLFRAEEAALKKLQDQDLQLNKLSCLLNELELERDTLLENLSKTSEKLSVAKTELNNWQHGHSSTQSEIQLELSRTIESLETEIEYLKKCINQKDETIRELTTATKNLQPMEREIYDKTRELDGLRAKLEELQVHCERQNKALVEHEKSNIIEENKRLESMLYERDAEIKRLQSKLSCLLIKDEEGRCTPTEAGSTPRPKRLRVSFADRSESLGDSDVSRHVAVAEMSVLPHYLSVAASEMPSQKFDFNESLPSPHAVNFAEKLDVERFVSAIQESDDMPSKTDTVESHSHQPDHPQHRKTNAVRKLRSILEDEVACKNGSISVPDVQVVSTTIDDQKSVRNVETICAQNTIELQNELQEVNQQFGLLKIQCTEYVSQISQLSADVESKSQRVHELIEEQSKVETELEAKCREIAELKKRQTKFERQNKCAVKERLEAQLKCEEYSRTIRQMEERLEAEQGKSNDLEDALQRERTACSTLQEKVANLESDVEKIAQELETAREKVKALSEVDVRLSNDSKNKSPDSSIVENQGSSLRNLTEKVQKEIERAEELDKNILKSLESDSRGASFIDELLKISSTLSETLKRILFKMLQEGPEGLTVEEKTVLIHSCTQHELDLVNDLKLKDELEKRLRLQLEVEQKANKELINNNRIMESELSRLEMIINYYEERMSFLVSKLDEYRKKAVKVEIELTSEKTSRRQLEISFESYKKEICDQRIQNDRKSDEYAERLSIAMNENTKLKREIDSLKNTLEVLTAELNSVKIITQYHSDSESDVSRSLNPLKVKLNEVQEKYSKVRRELETKKEEIRELKSGLDVERADHEKLENLYKVVLEEKHELLQKLLETKMKCDDLNWQKQKVDDKLRAAELYEVKRRMARLTKEGNAKKEKELRAEKLEAECKALRENLLKVAEEYRTLDNDWKRVCKELQTIFCRMMKAEKNQRCLTFQKVYIAMQLQKCRRELVTLTPSIVDISNFVYLNFTNPGLKGKRKFKSFVHCVIMIHRTRLMMKRRASSNHSKMVNYFQANLPGVKIHPWCSTSCRAVGKTETDAETYRTALKSFEHPFERRPRPQKDGLQSLYDQFVQLRETYVIISRERTDE